MVYVYVDKVNESEMIDTECTIEECFGGFFIKSTAKYVLEDEDDEDTKVLDIPS